VAKGYTIDSRWRNRAEFATGRDDIVAFLTRKWAKELDYRLIKELWAFDGDRISVRFAYEWHDVSTAPIWPPALCVDGSGSGPVRRTS
jgi:nuclear transport factor 2 (NTF2) superfamily protein